MICICSYLHYFFEKYNVANHDVIFSQLQDSRNTQIVSQLHHLHDAQPMSPTNPAHDMHPISPAHSDHDPQSILMLQSSCDNQTAFSTHSSHSTKDEPVLVRDLKNEIRIQCELIMQESDPENLKYNIKLLKSCRISNDSKVKDNSKKSKIDKQLDFEPKNRKLEQVNDFKVKINPKKAKIDKS